MGVLVYGGVEIEFDDRLLAHLQIVIVRKFRSGESFLMSWLDAVSVGDGRSAIWLSPGFPVYFKFLGSRVPAIDREWLRTLGESADSSSGLVVTDERGALARATGLRREADPPWPSSTPALHHP